MRRARHKSEDNAFYHVYTRVAGSAGDYPLQERQAFRKLIKIIRLFVRIYCSQLVAYEIMGSHYRFIVYIEKIRQQLSGRIAPGAFFYL